MNALVEKARRNSRLLDELPLGSLVRSSDGEWSKIALGGRIGWRRGDVFYLAGTGPSVLDDLFVYAPSLAPSPMSNSALESK